MERMTNQTIQAKIQDPNLIATMIFEVAGMVRECG